MRLTCVIVDDEPLARQLLEFYSDQENEISILGSFDNAFSAYRVLEEKEDQVDMVFLDLQLKQHSGLTILDEKKYDSIRFIITSAYPRSFMDRYQIQCFEWLQKPISYEIFKEAIEKVKVSKLQINK